MNGGLGSVTARCPRCGNPLAGRELGFACPRCLAAALVVSGSDLEEEPAAITSAIERLGDYELLEEVGRGGMGIVFRARQVTLDREVALKVIRDPRLASSADVDRFRDEAAAAARLAHPYIVRVHDIGEVMGRPYFAMEFIAGRHLGELTQPGPLSARVAAELVSKLADALQHAHERGVLHRDLKPSNVLVDAAGEPHVTDFGLAKCFDPATSGSLPSNPLTLTGQIMGTPAYMAPEQAVGHRGESSPATDIYSLGALLYHLVTGRAPFAGEGISDVLRQVAEREPLSPRLVNPSLPLDLATVCLKCLAKEPGCRYASARDLGDELRRFLRGEPIESRPPGLGERLLRWCHREPLVAGLSGLLILSVTVAALIAGHQIRMSRQQANAQRSAARLLAQVVGGLGAQMSLGRDLGETRRVLRATAAQVGGELEGDPEAASTLHQTLGQTWLAIGEYGDARKSFEQAGRLAQRRWGTRSLEVARARELQAEALTGLGELEAAEDLLREVLRSKEELKGSDSDQAATLHRLGLTLSHASRMAEAEAALREALTLQEATRDPARAATQRTLGYVLSMMGRGREAGQVVQAAIDLRREQSGDLHPEVARGLCELARARAVDGRWPEAEVALLEARRIQRTLLGTEHPQTLATEWQLAGNLADAGRLAEAETAYAELVPRFVATYGPDHLVTCRLRASLVRFREYRGDREAAREGWMELLAAGHEAKVALRSLLGLVASELLTPVLTSTPAAPVLWRVQMQPLPESWTRPEFPDETWPLAPAPFGRQDTYPRTLWTTKQIGLRTRFLIPNPAWSNLVLRIRHDDRIRVWLDGDLVVSNAGWSYGGHWLYRLPQSSGAVSAGGGHLLAVEVEDLHDGGTAEVELYAADDLTALLARVESLLRRRVEQGYDRERWTRALDRLRETGAAGSDLYH